MNKLSFLISLETLILLTAAAGTEVRHAELIVVGSVVMKIGDNNVYPGELDILLRSELFACKYVNEEL